MKLILGIVTLFCLGACDSGGDALGTIEASLKPAQAGKKDHKVVVCHHAGPHGKIVTIEIDASALPAHLDNHGDDWAANEDGSCGGGAVEQCAEGETPCTSEAGGDFRCCGPIETCYSLADHSVCD